MKTGTRFYAKVILYLLLGAKGLTLYAQPSGWIYDESDYQFSTEKVSLVQVGGIAVEDGWLGAFAGDECRGYAAASLFPPTGNYIFTLLYASNTNGESITFKYSPDGIEELDIAESVVFIANETGNARDPDVLNVVFPNTPPVFTSSPVTEASEDEYYVYSVTASDADGDALTFAAKVLPGWLGFDAGTGVLSGTPTNDHVGTHDVTLTVGDGIATVKQSFVITVANTNDAPVFTSTPNTGVVEGTLYEYTATASDADGDALTFAATVLPAWLSFNAGTGVLSGTPTNDHVGTHDVTLTVGDGIITVEQSFVITVANTNDAPVFTSVPVTAATENSPYTYKVEAEDIDGDALTYAAQILPAWLSFDAASQVLSGTPDSTAIGVNMVELTVSDGIESVLHSFEILVSEDTVSTRIALYTKRICLSVYPNPTTGKFFVELPEELYADAVFEIHDVTGKVVLKKQISAYSNKKIGIDISDLDYGTYFIVLKNKNRYHTGRIIRY